MLFLLWLDALFEMRHISSSDLRKQLARTKGLDIYIPEVEMATQYVQRRIPDSGRNETCIEAYNKPSSPNFAHMKGRL